MIILNVMTYGGTREEKLKDHQRHEGALNIAIMLHSIQSIG